MGTGRPGHRLGVQRPGTAPLADGVLAGDEAVGLPDLDASGVEVVVPRGPRSPEQEAKATIDAATSNTVTMARSRLRDTPGRIMATNVAIPAWDATFLSPDE
ncbi:hypothetical protein [Gordonia polyisoprenivorans]|uniref:hypothetical protein n=1 Tax=Gordonia polyisoprenivorans TaxID=84595 RepID=UPI0003728194|nr:hypothetical protein [Gordonia polyisoprenivorans]